METSLVKLIQEKKLFEKNEKIIVALSGGVDSMVLFNVLYELNKNIIIAHINHKARSVSDDEFIKIKEFAKKCNVPFEGFVITEKLNNNFHQDARDQRYNFFKAIAQKHQVKKIFLAHHQDDQVETILMRLVRGTSFGGYAGIPIERKERNIVIIRPFMDITKKQILDYAYKNDITYYEDESNQEDYYTRNRFRNNIIPLLRDENPKFNDHVSQFADYISSADMVLNRLKNEFLKNHCFYNTVSLEAFNKLDRAIMIKVIMHLVNQGTLDTVEVSFDHYNQIISLCLSKQPNSSISLGKGFDFIKEYDYIYVKQEEVIPEINITVAGEGEHFVSDNKSYVFSYEKLEHNNSKSYELCYNDKVFPLYIRQRKNGDKMSLKVGTKKVKDILIDKKIPVSKRDKLLLIANEEYVLWIPGIKRSIQEPKQKILYIYEVE